jgi:hypothetical protein
MHPDTQFVFGWSPQLVFVKRFIREFSHLHVDSGSNEKNRLAVAPVHMRGVYRQDGGGGKTERKRAGLLSGSSVDCGSESRRRHQKAEQQNLVTKCLQYPPR